MLPHLHRSWEEVPPHEGGGSASVDPLAERLGEVARLLQSETDTRAMLREVLAAAVQLIPGTQEASISVVSGRRQLVSEHGSGDLPRQVDEVQTDLRAGPCLDAAFEHRTVRVPDLRREQRWPEFTRRAHELGVSSMLCFPLSVQTDNLGALNLFSREAHAFDDGAEQIGLLFSSHAAVAFAEARKLDQLAEAADHRDLIGQAKGVLMERYAIDAHQAFAVLLRVSQGSNRKLHDVAHDLATTRQLQELRPTD